MKQEVVVTGYGIVSSIGLTVAEFKENLFAGKSGVCNIRGSLVGENFPVPYAACVGREKLPSSRLYGDQDQNKILKSWLMSEEVTRQALTNLDPRYPLDAIVYGTADGCSYEIVEEILRDSLPANYDYKNVCSESSLEIVRKTASTMGFQAVEDRNLISLNGACATGNQTLGIAFEGIRHGRWQRCLVGGVDARCEGSNFLNFFLLGALTTDNVEAHKASRPFAKNRSGFVRGEGAATLILESRSAAEARGAKILGVISGYGCTSDAYRLTDGREDGASVAEAMRLALRTANLETNDIDYINAHGTSTPLNDRLETLAIKNVFGEKAKTTPVSSIKSQIGHSTIAASAIEAVACLLMIEAQKVSPTLNLDEADPECDLDFVPHHSRELKINHILSNSFGFGGQNTCVVISKAPL